MPSSTLPFALVGIALTTLAASGDHCPTYQHTISGVSSGGSMAMIHAISRSSCVRGVGVIAGSTYGCNAMLHHCPNACGSGRCECQLKYAWMVDAYLQRRAKSGQIDDLSNLKGVPAWLFSGTSDDIVYQCVMNSVSQQLTSLGVNVEAVDDLPAAHGWVVDGRNFPNKDMFARCGHHGPFFIENCRYNMSLLMFKHLYASNLQPMASPFHSELYGNLMQINQAAYVPKQLSPASIGMSRLALAYVPTKCWLNAQTCTIHVHYHGCGGGGTNLEDAASIFWVEMPYIAETNSIIVLYPQAVPADDYRHINPEGCWDWRAYYDRPDFDTHAGAQMGTVLGMVSDLYRIVADKDFLGLPLRDLSGVEVWKLGRNRTNSDTTVISV